MNPNTPLRCAPLIAIAMFSFFLVACGKAPENAPSNAQKPKENITVPVETPLAKAAIRGNITEVKAMLDKGASPKVSDALGRTPLHMAMFYGHPKTSALLISKGADVNAKDRVGMTPLHAAVLAGSLQGIELLLDNQAEVNAVTDTGASPLHLAAATGQVQIVKFLIQRGANPLSKDMDGATPFIYADKNQHPVTKSLFQQYEEKAEKAPNE